jgi:hypothetical protein
MNRIVRIRAAFGNEDLGGAEKKEIDIDVAMISAITPPGKDDIGTVVVPGAAIVVVQGHHALYLAWWHWANRANYFQTNN